MAKYSSARARPNLQAPIRTTDSAVVTFEDGRGYERDAKSALFLLAVSNMVREQTFYEGAWDRDRRFQRLIRQVVASEPEWIAGFVPYLRNSMQMRSASVVMAAEYVKAGAPHGRQVVASALHRADEPAEILAYWAQTYGKQFPKPLKRGVADAVQRLYTERAALKYDGAGAAWRMADVIELSHAHPLTPRQSSLFKWLLDKRHRRETVPDDLPMIAAQMRLEAAPVAERRALLDSPQQLAEAGMTWERLSGWLQGPMDAAAWEAQIPQMGYMALLRNLRNFEQAGVSDTVLRQVATKLADPAEVMASRQFPIRFYSAFKNLASERFGWVLEQALEASLRNIPEFTGRTLVLVDASGSMNSRLSNRSEVMRWETAALFGTALAKRCEQAELIAYSGGAARIPYDQSVLRTIPLCMEWPGAGRSTNTFAVLADTYQQHDRVVILTDEQHSGAGQDILDEITCPIYTFNLAGYQVAQMQQGEHGRYVFGGLTDAGFAMLKTLEEFQNRGWPWLRESV